jgi:hypothetical protein
MESDLPLYELKGKRLLPIVQRSAGSSLVLTHMSI